MTEAREALFPASRLAEWFDGFVGSERERAIADALLHAALAAERIADPRLHPPRLRGSADLSTWMNGVAGSALEELRAALADG